MAILGCWNEDIDFIDVPGGGINVYEINVKYSRCLICSGSAYQGYNGYAGSTPLPGGAVTSCWFHFCPYKGSTATDHIMAGLIKSGNSMAGLYLTYSGGYILLQTRSSAGAFSTLATAGSAGFSNQYDMHLENYGASATVNVYAGGGSSPIVTFSGDVRISGLTDVDAVGIYGDQYQARLMMCEFIIADEDTRAFSLATLAPNAAGDTNDWTGAYTAVDEITINDTDLIYTDTATKDFQCNLTNTPAGTFSVRAVKVIARAAKSSDASIGTLDLGIKSGGTVNVDGGHSLTTSWVPYERLMTVNPVTSSAFTSSECDSLQVDLRSAS